MKNILKDIILKFQDSGIPDDLIVRDYDLSPFIETKNAVVISGPRRAGKTYLLYHFVKEMITDMRQVVYINFENNMLVDFRLQNLEEILQAYYELYPDLKPVLFLDEIHNVEGWELFARKLVDSAYKVFITGSNAELLSREYATKLGGRYLELEISPLSFKQFLRFKNITYDRNILHSKNAYKMLELFREFMTYGGFPEIVLSENPLLKEKLIDSYFQTAIYRDIIYRHSIRDEEAFQILLKKTAENIGSSFSFRSIAAKLNSLGLKLSVKTVIKYYEIAARGYLLIASRLFRESVVTREGERKFYFVDNSFLRTFFVKNNHSKLFENLVAIYFFNLNRNLMYFRNSFEIDFIVNQTPFQVCYDISDSGARGREIKSLLKYMKYANTDKGYLLTMNENEVIKDNGREVVILPFWYYSLFPDKY